MKNQPIYYVSSLHLVYNSYKISGMHFQSFCPSPRQREKARNCIFSCFRRDRAMSGLLTGVVVVLVICHTPRTFINIQVTSLTPMSSPNTKIFMVGEHLRYVLRTNGEWTYVGQNYYQMQSSAANTILSHQYPNILIQGISCTVCTVQLDLLWTFLQDFKFRAALKTFCSSLSTDRLSNEETVNEKEGLCLQEYS